MSNIRNLREKANLTQCFLAEKLGVTQACIAAWESGKAFPSGNKVPKLAKVLGCTIDELYRADE